MATKDETTAKPDKTTTAAAPAATKPAAADGKAVTFADRKFKSRTFVLADGRAFPVEKSRIVATDPALISYLEKHPDFKRVPAGEA